jgi:hypothetical protein
MTHSVTRILTLPLAATLSMATTGAQAPPDQSAATTPTNVARVYVQTANGVNVYTTSSAGKLTLVSGSPFKNTTGQMIGMAGSHLITVGTNYIHSYAIKSTGGIGAQLAQINSALYSGAACGVTDGGTIDRTGTEAYIQFQFLGSYDQGCDALQSYKIDASTGTFTFGGVAQFGGTYNERLGNPLVVAGNNGHAYTFPMYRSEDEFQIFYRDRFGAMNDAAENTVTFPPPNGGVYFPIAMASDNQNVPTSHMAVALHEDFGEPCGGSTAPVLASYTIDYNGSLVYNGAMIKSAINPASMAINPQGNLLAVGASTSYSCYTQDGPGLQVFHFNGGKPITGYSNILTKNPINSIAWDKSNHLYATSHATNKLYVFTITPTSITPLAGSPFTLSGPSKLVVRPL